MSDRAKRDRHLSLLAEARLELWRIRGRAAAASKMPRQLPRIPSKDAAIRAERSAAWLAGYDGAARAPQFSLEQQRATR